MGTISSPPGPVYAIGAKAETWSENAEPDEYGFRKLNVPDTCKLLNHYDGFGAKTINNEYYCCGVTDVQQRQVAVTQTLAYADTPTELEDVEGVRVFHMFSQKSGSMYSDIPGKTQSLEVCGIAKKKSNGTIFFKIGYPYIVQEFSSQPTNRAWLRASEFSIGGKLVSTFVPAPANIEDTTISLSDNGESVFYFNHNAKEAAVSLKKIGFKAIKVFSPFPFASYGRWYSYAPIVQYLSEDKLLDNDPSKFTLGTVRDVWVYQLKAYVLAEDKNLYEATVAQGGTTSASYIYDWVLQGKFDVKKFEMPSKELAFMLTRDGKLYHKGSAVADIAEKHEEFTQIFPECYFHDFTFGANTLTVIKE